MRLLNVHTLKFSIFEGDEIPRYVIASHRWAQRGHETSFQDVLNRWNTEEEGYRKVLAFARYVRENIPHLDWIWIDTCCINKADVPERDEAIVSMFKWYAAADVCLAYLADVEGHDELESFKCSEWFRRGWTLQELIAPATVVFLTKQWTVIGHKGSTGRCKSGIELCSGPSLTPTIAAITGVPESVLFDYEQSGQFNVYEKTDWVTGRRTTKEEDMTYSLLGLCGVSMPVIYGEGRERARRRLLTEVNSLEDGHSAESARQKTRKRTLSDTSKSDNDGHSDDVLRKGHKQAKTISRRNVASYSHTSLQPVVTYVARPALQQQMEERFNRSRSMDSTRSSILVLSGLGGAGKSQLALNYVQSHRSAYAAVFWVDSRLRESLERDYVQIYCQLYDCREDSGSLRNEMDRVVTGIKAWFSGRNEKLLFVFDNADSLYDETDHAYVDLQHYLPDAPCLEIVVTTRSQIATGLTELDPVDVGRLTQDEAVNMLIRSCKLQQPGPEVLAEASNIVDELDYFALAITLAGAHIAATPRFRSDIMEYSPEYRKRRKALLGRKATRQSHQYEESVLSTWETSYMAIAKKCPTAARLLTFFAFLDPNDICLDMFRTRPLSVNEHEPNVVLWKRVGLEHPNIDWRQFIFESTALEEKLDEAIETLLTYCLVESKEESGLYSMHKLVHAWAFDRIGQEEQTEYSLHCLGFLKELTSVPLCCLDHTTISRLVLHVSSSVERLREWRHRSAVALVPGKSLDVIKLLTGFLMRAGHEPTGLELSCFELVERDRLRRGNKKNRKNEQEWLDSLERCAFALCSQGRSDEAIVLLNLALKGYNKLMGSEHPLTFACMALLARALASEGKLEAAEKMQRRALKGSELVCGRADPRTIFFEAELMDTLLVSQKYEAAERMAERAGEMWGDMFSQAHPVALTLAVAIGRLHEAQGRLDAAEKQYLQTLEVVKKSRVREKFIALSNIEGSMARLLCNKGEFEAAEQMARLSLERLMRYLGPQHRHTLRITRLLAIILAKRENLGS